MGQVVGNPRRILFFAILLFVSISSAEKLTRDQRKAKSDYLKAFKTAAENRQQKKDTVKMWADVLKLEQSPLLSGVELQDRVTVHGFGNFENRRVRYFLAELYFKKGDACLAFDFYKQAEEFEKTRLSNDEVESLAKRKVDSANQCNAKRAIEEESPSY
jgi:hypothetical protein